MCVVLWFYSVFGVCLRGVSVVRVCYVYLFCLVYVVVLGLL